MIPDLPKLISHDSQATPPDKYHVFKDVSEWTVNVGYPGYANPAIDEIFGKWTLPRMFAQAASGKVTPGDALDQAYKEVQLIYQTWSSKGKI